MTTENEDSRVVTGECPMCSFVGQIVTHGYSWCPKTPAIMKTDTNGGRWLHDERRFARIGRVTRPVDIDEILLILDNGDGLGSPFATWGRALERISPGGVGEAIEVGHTTGNGWLYVDNRKMIEAENDGLRVLLRDALQSISELRDRLRVMGDRAEYPITDATVKAARAALDTEIKSDDDQGMSQ